MVLSIIEGLWLSNGIASAFAIVIAVCWGNVIKQVGRLQFKLSKLVTFSTNKWFVALVLVGLVGTIVTYYAQALIGVGKGQLFYHTGTVVLVVFQHFRQKEKFSKTQVIGAALIFIGSAFVT